MTTCGPTGDDLIIMTVERAADGRWQVVADDGSICEGGFASRGAATRWIEDRSDLSDVEVRSMAARCSPAPAARAAAAAG